LPAIFMKKHFPIFIFILFPTLIFGQTLIATYIKKKENCNTFIKLYSNKTFIYWDTCNVEYNVRNGSAPYTWHEGKWEKKQGCLYLSYREFFQFKPNNFKTKLFNVSASREFITILFKSSDGVPIQNAEIVLNCSDSNRHLLLSNKFGKIKISLNFIKDSLCYKTADSLEINYRILSESGVTSISGSQLIDKNHNLCVFTLDKSFRASSTTEINKFIIRKNKLISSFSSDKVLYKNWGDFELAK
jgi:hypothetical protein